MHHCTGWWFLFWCTSKESINEIKTHPRLGSSTCPSPINCVLSGGSAAITQSVVFSCLDDKPKPVLIEMLWIRLNNLKKKKTEAIRHLIMKSDSWDEHRLGYQSMSSRGHFDSILYPWLVLSSDWRHRRLCGFTHFLQYGITANGLDWIGFDPLAVLSCRVKNRSTDYSPAN